MLICPLCALFDEMSFHVFHPFSKCIFCFLLLSFESSLSPLLEMWFANIFSQSLASLFIALTGSFAEQDFLTLMKSIYCFPFMDHAFGI